MSKAVAPPRLPGLIDAHCHLDYPPMSGDVGGTLQRAEAAGVVQVVHVGCSRGRWDAALELVRAHQEVFAVLGVHPHEAAGYDDDAEARIAALSTHEKVVAVGETGLDYHYDHAPRPVQREALARQADLARRLNLPLVLHVREAHDEALEILRSIDLPRGGMVHCFTADTDTARRWLDLGMYVSFSGIVTFPRATEVAEASRFVPEDRLLLETDAPYLAPVPVRGRPNVPANVAHTCARVAALRGVDPRELARAAAQNTRRLLGIPEPAPSGSGLRA